MSWTIFVHFFEKVGRLNDDRSLNQSQIENFKKAIDFGRLNNVEVKVTINGGKWYNDINSNT